MVDIIGSRTAMVHEFFKKFGYSIYRCGCNRIITRETPIQRSFFGIIKWGSIKSQRVGYIVNYGPTIKVEAYHSATKDDIVALIGVLSQWEEETGEKTTIGHKFSSI